MDEGSLVQHILERHGRGLVFHAIVASLCPRIPMPLVDGIAGRIVRSSMFSRLGTKLTARELYRLSAEPEDPNPRGCMRGCLSQLFFGVVLYPVSKVKKMVDTLRNYEELVDLAAHTFVEGYLVAYVLARELWPEQGAPALRKAVDHVCFEVGARPVQAVFATVLLEARTEVAHALNLMVKNLRKLGPARLNRRQVTQALDQMESEEERILDPIMTRVLAALDKEPRDYFLTIQARIREQLKPALG
jgi:hypothetical protein